MITGNQVNLIAFLNDEISRSDHGVNEVALLAGFKNPKTLELCLSGAAKLPIDKIGPLSTVLGCDRQQLAMLVIRTWFSQAVLMEMACAFEVSNLKPVERQWVEALTEVFRGELPEVGPAMMRRLKLLALPLRSAEM